MTDFDDDDILVGDQVEDAFADAPRLSPALRRWLSGDMPVDLAHKLGLSPDDDR